jgi:hypothetical protein
MFLSEIDSMTNASDRIAPINFTPFGTAITVEEISERLSASLYAQLSENDDSRTMAAVQRAQVYVASVLRRLNVSFNLDNKAVREVVLIHAIYELHIALGHEEAGREYRLKAKDIIIAAWGEFPDTDNATAAPSAIAALARPKRRTW